MAELYRLDALASNGFWPIYKPVNGKVTVHLQGDVLTMTTHAGPRVYDRRH